MATKKILTDLDVSGEVKADSIVKEGGTSSQFLKADGSVDSNTYLTSQTDSQTLSISGSDLSISNGNTVTLPTGDTLTTEEVQDIVGAMFTGNTETRVSATYQDGDGTIDIVVDDMTADTTYVSSDFNHDDLTGFVANEHIDWTTDQGATNIHSGNYTDTNTWRAISSTPTNGATTTSISSDWAFDNVKTAVPAGAVFTDTIYDSSDFVHDDLIGFVENEHIDWTIDQGATNIHSGNYTNTTYVSSDFNHDDLTGFVADEHIDWTVDQGATNIHSGNYTNTTYTSSDFNHDDLTGFVANEHIDWTVDQGATNIHANNYTNTTYTSSDFTHDSLTGVDANEHIDWTVDQGATNIHANNYTDTNTWRGIHDTPVVEATTISISSNWAFDNVKTPVPSGAVFTDTVYTHPTHAGDDINIDTGALTGATVISDLDFNVTTDTNGHVTDANAAISTRNLTLADLGYVGDANATDTAEPAIESNGVSPSLASGITAAEVRTLIGAGTNSEVPAITSNGIGPSLNTGITAAEVRALLDTPHMGVTTAGYIARWSVNSGELTSSLLYQYGSSAMGIGTLTASARLHIDRTETSYAINLGNTDTRAGLKIYNSTNDDSQITFSQGVSGAQLIQASNQAGTAGKGLSLNPYGGDVGIGTASPNSLLEISGASTDAMLSLISASTDAFMRFYDADNGGSYSVGLDTSTEEFKIAFDYDSNSLTTGTLVKINTSGNITANNFILDSDERLKENIEEVEDKAINVDWKTFEMKSDKGQKRYGVIAQELEEVHPEFVRTDNDGMKSVAYTDLLIAKIAELEARLEKAGL